MNETEQHVSGVSDETWRKWQEQGKRRDRERAQRTRTVAGVVIVVLLIALGLYLTLG